MAETIQIELPKELIEKAKNTGVNLEKFRKSVQNFAILDMTARTSKLSKKDALIISKKAKSSAWAKIKKNLNML